MKNKNKLLGLFTAIAFASTPLHAADIVVSANITTPTTWTANNIYILTQPIFVKNNTTLTIEPGTLVLGVGDNNATSSRTDDLYGSLIITRGSKLMAEGTAAAPIIFDAYASVYGFDDNGRNTGPTGPRTGTAASRGFPAIQNTNSNGTGTAENPNAGASPATPGSPLKSGGLWGGIILLGKAQVNHYTDPSNPASQQSAKTIEGFPVVDDDDIKYGAATTALWDNADNSGVLRYMSLRFGGYEFNTGSEINGLTMGGVGSGTVIEYIEVVSNNDDGFEFFGGAVNTKYLVSVFNKDDQFDIDEGHIGVHQFWFGIMNNTTTTTFGDNGLELDGGWTTPLPGPPVVDRTNNFPPFTTPDIFNITVIGKGIAESGHAAARLRDQHRGKFYNSLFTDFGTGIRAETSLDASVRPVITTTVSGNMITTGSGTFRVSASGDAAGANTIMTSGTNTVPTFDTVLKSISRTPFGGLDPRPVAGSIAFTHTRTTPAPPLDTIVSTESFNGAFGNTLWIDGWTFLAEKGYLPAAAPVAPPFADVDGDGISDTLEATTALTDLGFSVGVNNVTNHGGVPGTNRFDSIYTETSILDLVTGNQVMIQGGGNGGNTTLSIPLFRSNDLSTPWAPAPALDATFTGVGEKEFYRIEVSGAN